jgi:nucleotide-binding universal stress UspA family protein
MTKLNAPILVATDASTGSLGAVRVARALASLQNRPLVAVAVLEPVVFPGSGLSYPLLMAQPELEQVQEEGLQTAVEAQLDEAGGGRPDWTIEIVRGAPAPTIVRKAVEHGAEMIVLGIGRHDASDRWLGTETALKVTHLAHVPVLAVHPDAAGIPRRALVAVDFSDFCRTAARSAIDCMPEHAELHLAHVTWTIPAGSDAPREIAWTETYRIGARARLEDLRAELVAGRNLRCVSTLLEGETARALIKYARMSSADLIATGSHGYGFLGRMMMGSVSTRILRQAPCSVLVSPPQGIAIEATEAEPMRIFRPADPVAAT